MNILDRSYKNPLYNSWKDMRKRCNNPNNKSYQWYGGKGIKVCKEWNESFSNFVQDMKEGYFLGATLDRKENNKDYNKDNCRWVTIKEQQRNRSNTPGHWKRIEEIKALRVTCLSQLEIGRKLGMSQARVSDILLGKGLK